MKERHQNCETRIDQHLNGRIADLTRLWDAYRSGNEDADSDLGTMAGYGLCFDYIAPGTFDDQAEGYFRYQLSCGADRVMNSASLSILTCPATASNTGFWTGSTARSAALPGEPHRLGMGYGAALGLVQGKQERRGRP